MPRTVYRPGESVTVSGVLRDMEANVPLPGIAINLQQYDPTTGLWRNVSSTTSGSDGAYSFTFTLPTEEGTVRIRVQSVGTPEYASDASPSVSLTTKKPKAAKTMLSIVVP
jgi:uncharacterized protein YfaS (alpha-2-macroglobulin family)